MTDPAKTDALTCFVPPRTVPRNLTDEPHEFLCDNMSARNPTGSCWEAVRQRAILSKWSQENGGVSPYKGGDLSALDVLFKFLLSRPNLDLVIPKKPTVEEASKMDYVAQRLDELA